MQTYNSFNEMAAAQSASPLVSDMSVFNADTVDMQKWNDDIVPLYHNLPTIISQIRAAYVAFQEICTNGGICMPPLKRHATRCRNYLVEMLDNAHLFKTYFEEVSKIVDEENG